MRRARLRHSPAGNDAAPFGASKTNGALIRLLSHGWQKNENLTPREFWGSDVLPDLRRVNAQRYCDGGKGQATSLEMLYVPNLPWHTVHPVERLAARFRSGESAIGAIVQRAAE